jgi:DNA-binding CsgD family transcriptional regulator
MMREWISPSSRAWALAAVIGGIALLLGVEVIDQPDATALDLLLELINITPIVMTSVGLVLLFQVAQRQRDDQAQLIRDLELARAQGQRWRAEARSHLIGLGEAIEAQFSRWNLTAAERDVALLLLKGLSLKEIATIRASSERTVREQARALYAKAGLTGRAALSAFFLEDLSAPIEGLLDDQGLSGEAELIARPQAGDLARPDLVGPGLGVHAGLAEADDRVRAPGDDLHSDRVAAGRRVDDVESERGERRVQRAPERRH